MHVREAERGGPFSKQYVLMLAVTGLNGEPVDMLTADLVPTLLDWKRTRGKAAADLLVTVITEQHRIEEFHRALAQLCQARVELAGVMRELGDATLMFGTPEGQVLAQYDLRQSVAPAAPNVPVFPLGNGRELRVALGPVLFEGRTLARVVALFVNDQYSHMWAEGWTGRQWSSQGNGLPPVEACMCCQPVAEEWLAARNVVAPAWPVGYTPPPGI